MSAILPPEWVNFPVLPLGAYLKVTEQVTEGITVGDDGALPPTVYGTHQGEGQVQDVAV